MKNKNTQHEVKVQPNFTVARDVYHTALYQKHIGHSVESMLDCVMNAWNFHDNKNTRQSFQFNLH